MTKIYYVNAAFWETPKPNEWHAHKPQPTLHRHNRVYAVNHCLCVRFNPFRCEWIDATVGAWWTVECTLVRWRELCSNELAVGTCRAKLSKMIASDKVEIRNTNVYILVAEIKFLLFHSYFVAAILLLFFFLGYFCVSVFGVRSSALCRTARLWLLRAACDSGNSGVKLNWPTFFESFHFHTLSSVWIVQNFEKF